MSSGQQRLWSDCVDAMIWVFAVSTCNVAGNDMSQTFKSVTFSQYNSDYMGIYITLPVLLWLLVSIFYLWGNTAGNQKPKVTGQGYIFTLV